jgi:hypothetical protein
MSLLPLLHVDPRTSFLFHLSPSLAPLPVPLAWHLDMAAPAGRRRCARIGGIRRRCRRTGRRRPPGAAAGGPILTRVCLPRGRAEAALQAAIARLEDGARLQATMATCSSAEPRRSLPRTGRRRGTRGAAGGERMRLGRGGAGWQG